MFILSGTLNSGTTTTTTCTVEQMTCYILLTVMVITTEVTKVVPIQNLYAIDAVCWNDGSGSDSSCDGASDAVIEAGLWAEDTYVNDAS